MGNRQFIKLACLIAILLLGACVPPQEMNSARSLYQSGRLEDAYRSYQSILQKDPNNREAKATLEKIKQDIANQAITQAQQACDPGSSKIDQVDKAISILNQASRYAPHNQELVAVTQRYQSQRKKIKDSNLLKTEEFKLALRDHQYSTAQQILSQIENSDPTTPGLAGMRQNYKSAYTSFLKEDLKAAVQNKDFERAHKNLAALKTLGLPAADISQLAGQIKTAEAASIKRQIKALLDRNRYYTAYLLIISHGYEQELASELDHIRSRGSRFYLEQSSKRLSQGNISRAYLESVKGLELDPNNSELFDLHRDTRDQVLQRAQQYIAIPLFGAPREQPDLGPQLSDALISYLFRILPYGVNIVEREKIDLLLEEQKLEYKKVGSLLNVGLIITGNISLLNIDRQESSRTVTTKVKTGEQTISNPEYEAWLRLSPESRRNTTQPKKLLAIPSYQTFTYKKGKVTLKGFTSVSLRIFDTHKGSVTYAQEFNANYTVSDEFQDELELAGISGDPLELPSNTEIREKLRNKIIRQIAAVVGKQFDNRQHAFLVDAKYYLSRHENDKALDKLAQGFLYCIKAKIKTSDPDYTEVRDKAIKFTEIDFLPI
jgi:hypothetical protein